MTKSGTPVRPLEQTTLLKGMDLFKDVRLESIGGLLGRCEERRFNPGEILLSPDTLNDEMYVILSGEVSIHLDTVESMPLTTLGTGECVGEMSLFDGKPPSAHVRVVEPSDMLVIRRAHLWEMMDVAPEIARNLLQMLSGRLRATNIAMTEIQKQKRRHERAASLDVLTGLNNRRSLESILADIRGKELVPLLPLSLVMLDVDHFKHLNDEWGHAAGDVTLQALAALFQDNVRPHDIVARYGGDEFIILLPRTPGTGASILAERLRKLVAEARFEFEEKPLPAVTVSAGIAVSTTVRKVEDVIKEADAALYRAKRSGRNRVDK